MSFSHDQRTADFQTGYSQTGSETCSQTGFRSGSRSPTPRQKQMLSPEESPCIRSRSPSPMLSIMTEEEYKGCLREQYNARNLAIAQICCGKAIAICDIVALIFSLLNSGHPPSNFVGGGIVAGAIIAVGGAAAFHHERRRLKSRHSYKHPVVCGFNFHTHMITSAINMLLSTVAFALFIFWMFQLGVRIRSHKAAHLKDSDEVLTEITFATNFIGAMAALLCFIATLSSLQLVCFSKPVKMLIRSAEGSRRGSILFAPEKP